MVRIQNTMSDFENLLYAKFKRGLISMNNDEANDVYVLCFCYGEYSSAMCQSVFMLTHNTQTYLKSQIEKAKAGDAGVGLMTEQDAKWMPCYWTCRFVEETP